MFFGRNIHSRSLSALAALALLAWTSSANAGVRIDIAPQPLGAALKEFGVKTGRPVLYMPELVEAKSSKGASQARDPESALTALLDGTGLTYRRERNIFLVVAVEPEQAKVPRTAARAAESAKPIIFDAAPLEEVASEMNRYNTRKIVIADAVLGRRRISGSFRSNEPETFARAIEAYGLARIAAQTPERIELSVP